MFTRKRFGMGSLTFVVGILLAILGLLMSNRFDRGINNSSAIGMIYAAVVIGFIAIMLVVTNSDKLNRWLVRGLIVLTIFLTIVAVIVTTNTNHLGVGDAALGGGGFSLFVGGYFATVLLYDR